MTAATSISQSMPLPYAVRCPNCRQVGLSWRCANSMPNRSAMVMDHLNRTRLALSQIKLRRGERSFLIVPPRCWQNDTTEPFRQAVERLSHARRLGWPEEFRIRSVRLCWCAQAGHASPALLLSLRVPQTQWHCRPTRGESILAHPIIRAQACTVCSVLIPWRVCVRNPSAYL